MTNRSKAKINATVLRKTYCFREMDFNARVNVILNAKLYKVTRV